MNIVYPVQQELAEKNVVRVDRWLKASLNDCVSTFRFVFVRITALMPSSFQEYSPYGVGENHGNEVAVFRLEYFSFTVVGFLFTFTLRARGREITYCT